MNERDVPISWNMPPIYDLILEQDGELLIQMVEAIEASDAWRQGKQNSHTEFIGLYLRRSNKRLQKISLNNKILKSLIDFKICK